MLLRLGFTDTQIETMSMREACVNIDHAIRNPRNSFGHWLKEQKVKNGEL
jgi:hypothetical protein